MTTTTTTTTTTGNAMERVIVEMHQTLQCVAGQGVA